MKNTDLINTLRERLRGPYVHPDLSAEPNRHRAILAAVAMAATGGFAVCVLADINACHYAAKKATLFCTLADIEYSELRDGAGVILRIPGRQPQDGRIVFTPISTSHLKFKGAEITGVWVEAEHGENSKEIGVARNNDHDEIDAWRDNESQRNEQLQARVDELEGRGKCPDCGIQVNLLGTVEIPAVYCPDETCAWSSWLTPPIEDES